MGMFNFAGLRSALLSVKDRLGEVDRQIGKLEAERAKLVGLPLPYPDFCLWVESRFDRLADDYPRQVRQELIGPDSTTARCFMQPLDGHTTLDDFLAVYNGTCPIPFERPVVGFGVPNFGIGEAVMYFCLRDVLKAGVRRVLDEVVKPKWPAEVGPPRAERVKVLEKLEGQLTELIAERDGIRRELAGALPS
ncbi:hypothetical protein [Accumulibacter sp.]|uniref:hypothetical protein n=1 Tax=Accumulibacter sp. TaxID=2053492 RepID=UPI0026054F0D|nr:hypothetical protein [Accumulibacter sp.]